MTILASHSRALWADETGISSVEHVLLLAISAGGLMTGGAIPSPAVADPFSDTASCFDGSADANGGQGGGTMTAAVAAAALGRALRKQLALQSVDAVKEAI